MTSGQARELEKQTRTVVVAVGASAGGLKPLQELFGHLAADTGMTFVVVQHLSPDFESSMPELLARCTSMPIMVVADGMPIAPNTVYLNPPGFNVEIFQRTFVLSPFARDELSFPINRMFGSVASHFGSNAVGVVLSGTGSDGSTGIRSIHEMAGLTISQSPETSQFDGMPKNAIMTDRIDYVLNPTEIADLLGKHAKEPVVRTSAQNTKSDDSLSGVQLIFSRLSKGYRIDFTHYKAATVARRIERRLKLSRCGALHEYCELLRDDSDELDRLYHDLLIGVTQFFRDEEAFSLLRQEIELLVDIHPEESPIRIWSVGCASGEEAYSIGIMLCEAHERRGRKPNFKVFATDVHDQILETASRGRYQTDSIEGLSDELMKTYFKPDGEGHLRVVPRLRNRLVFAKHNVVTDSPFTKMDLVICRNLLIYLKEDAQATAIAGFRFALRDNGLMMLGPSETAGRLTPGFDVVDKGWRLFRKNDIPREAFDSVVLKPLSQLNQKSETLLQIETEVPTARLSPLSIGILSEVLGAALLINHRGQLLNVFGDAGKYLKPESDQEDIKHRVAFEGESLVAFSKTWGKAVREQGQLFSTELTMLGTNDHQAQVEMTAISFSNDQGDHPVALIRLGEPGRSDGDAGGEGLVNSELVKARANLAATINAMGATNEELQAANEEMIASNEELQATNEELQSVNEELHSVNAEYQQKVLELEEVTDDFNNIFNSSDVGSILLDEKLLIRKFTQSSRKYFRLMAHDVGRPLTNFAPLMRIDDLPEKIRTVIATGTAYSSYALNTADQWLSIEILPYFADRSIRGAILNMMDLSRAIKAAEDYTGKLTLHETTGLWHWDVDKEKLWWSRQLYCLLGLPETEPPSWRLFQDRIHEQDLSRIDFGSMLHSAPESIASIRIRVKNEHYQSFDFRWMSSGTGHGTENVLMGTLTPHPQPKAASCTTTSSDNELPTHDMRSSSKP